MEDSGRRKETNHKFIRVHFAVHSATNSLGLTLYFPGSLMALKAETTALSAAKGHSLSTCTKEQRCIYILICTRYLWFLSFSLTTMIWSTHKNCEIWTHMHTEGLTRFTLISQNTSRTLIFSIESPNFKNQVLKFGEKNADIVCGSHFRKHFCLTMHLKLYNAIARPCSYRHGYTHPVLANYSLLVGIKSLSTDAAVQETPPTASRIKNTRLLCRSA